jgi:hypothetical protein
VPEIKKRYIVNERNEPVEVIVDIATFERIEELLEDRLFGEMLLEASQEEALPLEDAKRRYGSMKKARARKRR